MRVRDYVILFQATIRQILKSPFTKKNFSGHFAKFKPRQHFPLYSMLGAKHGFGQSMDGTAQSVDPSFARTTMHCSTSSARTGAFAQTPECAIIRTRTYTWRRTLVLRSASYCDTLQERRPWLTEKRSRTTSGIGSYNRRTGVK